MTWSGLDCSTVSEVNQLHSIGPCTLSWALSLTILVYLAGGNRHQQQEEEEEEEEEERDENRTADEEEEEEEDDDECQDDVNDDTQIEAIAHHRNGGGGGSSNTNVIVTARYAPHSHTSSSVHAHQNYADSDRIAKQIIAINPRYPILKKQHFEC